VLCERVFRPLAHVLVVPLAWLRVPPPVVVVAAAATGLAGAIELARGELVAAALLVQLKTVLDNADGQLARLTGRVTAFGRYLDSELDLLVNAALFAALLHPLAVVGFVLLTLVLSTNFNAERVLAGRPAAWDRSVLGRAYGVLYGWQDRLADRALAGRVLAWHVSTLANLGMTTQLAAFGLCMLLGHPLAYVWILVCEAGAVVALFITVRTKQEVSVEHR
jgi:archaetidylinositol phosphate synthase